MIRMRFAFCLIVPSDYLDKLQAGLPAKERMHKTASGFCRGRLTTLSVQNDSGYVWYYQSVGSKASARRGTSQDSVPQPQPCFTRSRTSLRFASLNRFRSPTR